MHYSRDRLTASVMMLMLMMLNRWIYCAWPTEDEWLDDGSKESHLYPVYTIKQTSSNYQANMKQTSSKRRSNRANIDQLEYTGWSKSRTEKVPPFWSNVWLKFRPFWKQLAITYMYTMIRNVLESHQSVARKCRNSNSIAKPHGTR